MATSARHVIVKVTTVTIMVLGTTCRIARIHINGLTFRIKDRRIKLTIGDLARSVRVDELSKPSPHDRVKKPFGVHVGGHVVMASSVDQIIVTTHDLFMNPPDLDPVTPFKGLHGGVLPHARANDRGRVVFMNVDRELLVWGIAVIGF